MSLNAQQFGNIWDDHTESMREDAQRYPATGTMPIAEMKQHMDPVFKSWDHLKTQEHGYISNLADHVKRHGVIEPVVLNEHGVIYDGHHRVAAAEMAGVSEIPWRPISRLIPDKEPRHGYNGPGLPS